jgi:hypothetical protein
MWQKFTDVAEEYTASIIRVKKYNKQAINYPEDGESTFLRNKGKCLHVADDGT